MGPLQPRDYKTAADEGIGNDETPKCCTSMSRRSTTLFADVAGVLFYANNSLFEATSDATTGGAWENYYFIDAVKERPKLLLSTASTWLLIIYCDGVLHTQRLRNNPKSPELVQPQVRNVSAVVYLLTKISRQIETPRHSHPLILL